jgi:alpha-tubulin suppressor-like RCC1 family protein
VFWTLSHVNGNDVDVFFDPDTQQFWVGSAVPGSGVLTVAYDAATLAFPVGSAASFTPTVSNAVGAVSFTLTEGDLPGGVTFDPATGELSASGEFFLNNVDQVVGGSPHLCALRQGEVFCWGLNSSGQIGDGSTADRLAPVKVSDGAMGNSGVEAISAGGNHTCALKDGEVFCWGSNGSGRLGDGTTTSRSTPVKVSDGAMGNSGVEAISLGNDYTCALKAGEMFCWGVGGDGRLGDGTTTSRSTPVKVSDGAMGNSSVDAISAGFSHTCALKAGEVFCWGSNSGGKIGDGTTTNRSTPVKVSAGAMGNSGVGEISHGSDHTCALKAGEVYCWGSNGDGRLGDGTTTASSVPVKVSDGAMGNSGVGAISVGFSHTCALKAGEMFCWGVGGDGRLGDGTTTSRSTPVKVSDGAMGNSGVGAVSLGSVHTCALKAGEMFCWGSNWAGQLGDGTTISRSTPVRVINIRPVAAEVTLTATDDVASESIVIAIQAPANTPPQIGAAGDVEIVPDGDRTVNLVSLWQVTDVNGDDIAISSASIDDPAWTVTWSGGSVTVNAPDLGTATLTVSFTDGKATTAPVSVTIEAIESTVDFVIVADGSSNFLDLTEVFGPGQRADTSRTVVLEPAGGFWSVSWWSETELHVRAFDPALATITVQWLPDGEDTPVERTLTVLAELAE